MKQVVILSGKGGTGKTTITGSLAVLVKSKVTVDCDVDAADLHLLLNPTKIEEHEFWSGEKAYINMDKCIQCGLCEKICHFDAIKNYNIDEISCEGCRFCANVCPVNAIEMHDNLAGRWFLSNTPYGLLVHAELGIAQENSGKLVTTIKKKAEEIARLEKFNYVICDGPPGIGCPVISSISGANIAVIVTEPTLSGIHDMERVINTCIHFGIPVMICINKFDINQEITEKIRAYCKQMNLKIAAEIPYDTAVSEAINKGIPLVEYTNNELSQKIINMWDEIEFTLKNA